MQRTGAGDVQLLPGLAVCVKSECRGGRRQRSESVCIVSSM